MIDKQIQSRYLFPRTFFDHLLDFEFIFLFETNIITNIPIAF